MDISVIVCTHNRCELLWETLQSLMSQDYPVQDYEVIVVDNQSTDGTRDVVYKFMKKGGDGSSNLIGEDRVQVRYIFEEKIGLSNARNRGIAESRGDIVAFIDDDAIAERFWLSKLMNVYREEKDAVCVGGGVIAEWKIPKPGWWHPHLNIVSKFEYGDARTILRYPVFPIGTNISFKKNTVVNAGMFDTNLGRIGSKLSGYEEVDVCVKLQKVGQPIYYEPRAIVYHIVDGERLSRGFIRRRAYEEGRSQYLFEVERFGKGYIYRKSLEMIINIIKCIPGIFIRRTQRFFKIPGRNFVLMEQSVFFLLGYFFRQFFPEDERN